MTASRMGKKYVLGTARKYLPEQLNVKFKIAGYCFIYVGDKIPSGNYKVILEEIPKKRGK